MFGHGGVGGNMGLAGVSEWVGEGGGGICNRRTLLIFAYDCSLRSSQVSESLWEPALLPLSPGPTFAHGQWINHAQGGRTLGWGGGGRVGCMGSLSASPLTDLQRKTQIWQGLEGYNGK